MSNYNIDISEKWFWCPTKREYYREKIEPATCPFAFMEAQRQPEPEPPAPPSERTLCLWRAISFHGG